MPLASMYNFIPEGVHTAVALGFFDGVHRGHLAVLQKATAQTALTPCVFTFTTKSKTPDAKTGYTYLTNPQQKAYYLHKAGIQHIYNPDFADFKGKTPAEFVQQILHQTMHAKVVCCGENFHFGKDRAAGIAELRTLCAQLNITVEVAPAVLYAGEAVSSTRIRAAIRNGEVLAASQMLGRPYAFTAPVQGGKQLGRKLGFPTLNQSLPPEMTTPKAGVYATQVLLGNTLYGSITNIGKQPTVGGEQILAETYILDYQGELYGQEVEVQVLEYIRAVKKFESIDKLTRQVGMDIDISRKIHKSFAIGHK